MMRPPEFVEDVVDLHIRSDMTPAEQVTIQVRRALAVLATLGDIRTRLVG